MLDIGAPELLIILVVALIMFGPKKLPELGRGLGQSLREFQRNVRGLHDDPAVKREGEAESTRTPEPAPDQGRDRPA